MRLGKISSRAIAEKLSISFETVLGIVFNAESLYYDQVETTTHSTSGETMMLQALATLLTFQCLGEGFSYFFHLPVPGPVIGMLLLFGFILLRPEIADAIEPTALELLRHLSLLIIPAGVGIMVSAGKIRGDALAVSVSIAVSTTLAIVVTALVTRALLRRQRREPAGSEAAS